MWARGLVAVFVASGTLALGACEAVDPVQSTVSQAARPPRVLLVGDSILAQPARTITDQLDALGVQTYAAAVSGSGLLTGAVDWQARANRLVAQMQPDVVIALFVGNYPENTPADPLYDDLGPLPVDEAGTPIAADTPQFFDAWQDAAETLSGTLASRGAQVYWVEPPPMIEFEMLELAELARADELYAGYRQLDQTQPSVEYLSPRASVAGPAGEWISKSVACGTLEHLRAPDTVHFTTAGAYRYGQTLAGLLAAAQGWGTIAELC